MEKKEKDNQTTASEAEGLPEIAEPRYKRSFFLILLVSVLLLLATHVYFQMRKPTSKTEFSVE